MSYYEKKKEDIREQAKEWQHSFCEKNYSYGEITEFTSYFYKYGKKYGLLKEFRENAIL